MKRKPVQSTSIKSVGYDQQTKVLEIEFNSGVYQYANVLPGVYAELMAAESAGRYFAANIKNKYTATKV